jgi:hypothetical protein
MMDVTSFVCASRKIGFELLAGVTCALWIGSAHAGTVTVYQGQDNGSGVGLALSAYTNSNAAYQSFLTNAASFGAVETHGFGNASNGFHDVNFNIPTPGAGTINYIGTSPNLGVGISGVNDTTFGNLYGFGVGTNNDKWLGFPGGTATFTFAAPISSFGFWLTGLQQATWQNIITIAFNDGAAQLLTPLQNNNGGAQFFGFTDTTRFSSVTVQAFHPQGPIDYWGIDNVTFNTPVATPLPAALPLYLTGLGILGLLAKRRKKHRVTASA